MASLLVVDDDAETRDFLREALGRAGHQVSVASDRASAQAQLDGSFDLLILDVMLGAESGLALCAELRLDGVETPVLFLSARGTVGARVEGLDVGGDDYLPKPFAMRELQARVKALLRRRRAPVPQVWTHGGLTLDPAARRAVGPEGDLPVTPREWAVLLALLKAGGRVVAYGDLLEGVWGESTPAARASLEVHISRLRRKLDVAAGAPCLRTVRGLGYALGGSP